VSKHRLSISAVRFAVLAGLMAFAGAAQADQPVCKPALAVKDVQFSKWELPSMERKWSATVSVDASRCAANSSGHFEIGFARAKEHGPEIDFLEQFIWMAPSVKIGVDFWADEAVDSYWIEKVSPCACRE
jgi:hypothetical protein